MKKFKKQFGGRLTKELIARYEQSPNWKHGKFENLIETHMTLSFWDIPELLYKQFTDKKKREPLHPLPVLPFNREKFMADDSSTRFIWYGHSAILLRLASKTILIDPMLGSNASPIAPFKTKRFSKNTLDIIDDLPEIDLMILSHDHYDHLDYDSIQKLKTKTKNYIVALGVKRHLVQWGIDDQVVTEMDWWDEKVFSDISITFTPSRHFSGRGLKDRARSMWGGWVFKTDQNNIWFSGDGGYGPHFKEIGQRLGPFDFAFMECGQYNEKWRPIHMFPHESVQAAFDGGAKQAMPVHWAGFSLSQHSWTEPVEHFIEQSKRQNLPFLTPRLGEIVNLSGDNINESWWQEHPLTP